MKLRRMPLVVLSFGVKGVIVAKGVKVNSQRSACEKKLQGICIFNIHFSQTHSGAM